MGHITLLHVTCRMHCVILASRASGRLARLGGLDDPVDRVTDPVGGRGGVGLACVEPGGDRLDRHDRDEVCGPGCPAAVGYGSRELTLGDCHHGRAEPVHVFPELGLPGGVMEQEPEPGWVGGGGAEEGVDARCGVPPCADGLFEPGPRTVEDGPVQVGLRVEVPVEDRPADARLGARTPV